MLLQAVLWISGLLRRVGDTVSDTDLALTFPSLLPLALVISDHVRCDPSGRSERGEMGKASHCRGAQSISSYGFYVKHLEGPLGRGSWSAHHQPSFQKHSLRDYPLLCGAGPWP